MTALARPGANILLPRPGFPYYETRALCCNLEVRHFDLLPDQRWAIDLQSVETLSNENTIAIVVINPGYPCESVSTHASVFKLLIIFHFQALMMEKLKSEKSRSFDFVLL